MRPLVQLRQHVAMHVEHRIGGVAAEVHRHVVLPLDLVSEVVFVPRGQRVVDIQLFVGVPERDRADFLIQRRAAWIAAVIVTERAAGDGIDGRMPRRIALVIGPHDRVRVVLGSGAVVTRAWSPNTEGCGIAGGRTVIGRGRTVLAAEQRYQK